MKAENKEQEKNQNLPKYGSFYKVGDILKTIQYKPGETWTKKYTPGQFVKKLTQIK